MRLLLLVGWLGACAPERNECTIRTEPEVAVITELTFSRASEEGVSNGFDLDGEVTGDGSGPCGVGDYVDADGNTGIDNAFARVLPALLLTEANAVEGLIANAIASGELLLMFQLDGLDDPEQDECADFTLMKGDSAPLVGTDQKVLPGQTFALDAAFPQTTIPHVVVEDGVTVAGPFQLELPLQIFEVSIALPIDDVQMRVEIGPDGSYKGWFGGATSVEYLVSIAEYEDVDAALADILEALLDANADLDPQSDGSCAEISVNFDFVAQPAFFYPEPSAAE